MAEQRRRIRVEAMIHALSFGGAEVLLAEFAKAAPRVEIDFSVTYFREQDGNPIADRLRAIGVEPKLVPTTSMRHLSDFRRVRDHLRESRPDIVHTHVASADLFGGVAARMVGIPNVVTLHSTQWRYPDLRTTFQMGGIAILRRLCAARVIAVSESARSSYLAAWRARPDSVVTIPNGVDAVPATGSGRALREELGISQEETLVLMLSSLRPEKAHALAIAAIRGLRERRRGVRLVIVGDGPLRASVDALAVEAGSGVVMAGYRADPMPALDAADVLLHPSVHEAFPTTLLEAMATSVPIVATAVGGIPEMIDDGVNGTLLQTPASPGEVAGAVERLIDDPGLRERYTAAGRERVAGDFGVDTWVRRTRAVYDEVLAERR